MKFLIQTINNQIVHDFSFTLLEAIRYQNWKTNSNDFTYILTNETFESLPKDIPLEIEGKEDIKYSEYLKDYCPIGSVEFVCNFYKYVYGEEFIPKPINVPECLFGFANRNIKNVSITDNVLNLDDFGNRENAIFIKSNDKIKWENNGMDNKLGFINDRETYPVGNYQISDMTDIDAEYRCFVYKDELVGIHYYSGNFTVFPDYEQILKMKRAFSYLMGQAPVAYTLDIGVKWKEGGNETFVIECHDFYSCGLYGFSDLNKLPFMFNRWHLEHINKVKNKLS